MSMEAEAISSETYRMPSIVEKYAHPMVELSFISIAITTSCSTGSLLLRLLVLLLSRMDGSRESEF